MLFFQRADNMTTLFITSSGTGIGKTYVTVRLIEALRGRGHSVAALKPLITDWTDAGAVASDTGLILAALGEAVTPDAIDRISPWRYRAALAPDMAAAREGKAVPFDAVISWCRTQQGALAPGAVLLVEGAGGVLVPVDGAHTMRDMMRALDAVPILVVGSYLGTISHTLTALEALTAKGLSPLAIAVSESADADIPLADTCAVIARFAGDVPVVAVPRGGGTADAGLATLARLVRP